VTFTGLFAPISIWVDGHLIMPWLCVCVHLVISWWAVSAWAGSRWECPAVVLATQRVDAVMWT